MFARAILALCTALVLPAAGWAQGYEILVIPGENAGLAEQEFGDIVEESAYLVEDFGNFIVTRGYQLDRAVTRGVRDATLRCGADVNCYIGALFNGPFDYVLVVSAGWADSDLRVDYGMIDVRVGVLAAVTTAFLPTSTEFAHLMVPCHDALKVIPEWINRRPVAVAPDPPLAAAAPAPAPPAPQPEPRARTLGSLGRAGAYVAGAGGALVLGGVLMAFAADEKQQEIQAEPHERAALETLQDSGTRSQRTANAMLILGAAAVASGVTLTILDDGPDQPAVGLAPIPGGLSVRARF